jgi:tricorn protease
MRVSKGLVSGPRPSSSLAALVVALASALFLLAGSPPLLAQVDARMLQYPDVSGTHIAFEYAGDIWIVPKEGGLANRVTSAKGEESLPRFSPDGKWIAFDGNYDGNVDIYVVPAMGGLATRVTHQGMTDRMADWFPEGTRILYTSAMESGKQRFNQFYSVPREGGLPQKLPVPYGEFGSLSPDGKRLAYTPITRTFRTWKRYRGGMAADIWIFDLEKLTAENITNNEANDEFPMWHGNTIYFLSDRGPAQRFNLWAYDVATKATRQVTQLTDFDIHFPAAGPSDIVFEAGGKLYLFDIATEKTREVKVEVVTDEATLMPRLESAEKLIQNAWPSPDGKRAVFEARGDLFSVPAENGNVIDLTRTSGVAERYPAWSPDGKSVAYWSDRSGEYELVVRDLAAGGAAAAGAAEPKTLTSYGAGYRYQPYWSPDGKMMAFIDKAMDIQVYDRTSGKTVKIDRGKFMYQGELDHFAVSWSPDSRWLAYSRDLDSRHEAVFIYDAREGKTRQMTAGFYSDAQPSFDPDGKYLYFLTNRTFRPVYGDMDSTFIYANSTNVAAVPLRADVPSPLAPKNDEVGEKKEEGAKPGSAGGAEANAPAAKPGEKTEKKEEAAKPKDVGIDFEGFESRIVILPPEAGNYDNLQGVAGKVVYHRMPNTGSEAKQKPVKFYDLEKREEKTIVADADAFRLSADGKKMLAAKSGVFYVVDVAPEQKLEKKMPTSQLEMTVVPREEWRQIFNDVWRFERDFFYDPNMHGVDWNAQRQRYGKLIDDCVTREDVNYVIGELIAELSSSHTYRGGGAVEQAPRRPVGYLGVDWEVSGGAYRIKKIIRGAPWDSEPRSPLDRPSVKVKEGDFVLAVNGIALDPARDPWAPFEGLAGATVELTVNSQPEMAGARTVVVETMRDETRLRNLAWIESNRQRVEAATRGRIGYIYVPDTGFDGQNELFRMFLPQMDKEGLIVDERFNNGGQIPDRFIELLNRKPLAFWAVRDGKDWQWPPVANFGPKVMLINGWSGSGGDAFPDFFREAGLGPLIGMRTWGGLIGMSGSPGLIDGGMVTVPTFRMYKPNGQWFAEGHGVDPDIPVVEDPAQLAKGVDTQLERAIKEVLALLEMHPPLHPARPPYQKR